LHIPPLRAALTPLISVVLGGVFALYVLLASARVRDITDLLRAGAGISLVYVLLASPYYFPWYATLPLALLALSPHDGFRWLALVVTGGIRLVAPLGYLRDQGLMPQPVKFALTIVIAIALPLGVLLLLTVREWRHRGIRTRTGM